METSNGRVLVVEDVKVAQKVAIIMLNALGYEVDTADNGAQALELVSHRIYDIIFMDLGLPDIDGLTVAETIRKKEGQNRHSIIIALSAHSENENGIDNKKNCLDAGMDDYIEKPLTKELALKVLQKFLHT